MSTVTTRRTGWPLSKPESGGGGGVSSLLGAGAVTKNGNGVISVQDIAPLTINRTIHL
jgi:hypothetical protein